MFCSSAKIFWKVDITLEDDKHKGMLHLNDCKSHKQSLCFTKNNEKGFNWFESFHMNISAKQKVPLHYVI